MYVAVDLGGTNIRVAAAGSLKNPQLSEVFRTEVSEDYDEDLGFIIDSARQLARKRKRKIARVGISAAGVLNESRTQITRSFNNPHWEHQLPVEQLENILNCDVLMESDTKAGALGQLVYGGIDVKRFLYIVWGTDIAGALVDASDQAISITRLDRTLYFEKWSKNQSGRRLEELYGPKAERLGMQGRSELLEAFNEQVVSLMGRIAVNRTVVSGGVADSFEEFTSAAQVTRAKQGPDTGLYGGLALHARRDTLDLAV